MSVQNPGGIDFSALDDFQHPCGSAATNRQRQAGTNYGCAVRPIGVKWRQIINYFAYGSNSDLDRAKECLGTHGVGSAVVQGAERVRLDDYQLRTNSFASSPNAGACYIEPDPGSYVVGVLMIINEAVRDALRVKEGYPRRYTELDVHVFSRKAKRPLRALTYVVTPEHRLDTDLPVTARYREIILAGARAVEFTQEYQDDLCRKLKIAPSLRIVTL